MSALFKPVGLAPKGFLAGEPPAAREEGLGFVCKAAEGM